MAKLVGDLFPCHRVECVDHNVIVKFAGFRVSYDYKLMILEIFSYQESPHRVHFCWAESLTFSLVPTLNNVKRFVPPFRRVVQRPNCLELTDCALGVRRARFSVYRITWGAMLKNVPDYIVSILSEIDFSYCGSALLLLLYLAVSQAVIAVMPDRTNSRSCSNPKAKPAFTFFAI